MKKINKMFFLGLVLTLSLPVANFNAEELQSVEEQYQEITPYITTNGSWDSGYKTDYDGQISVGTTNSSGSGDKKGTLKLLGKNGYNKSQPFTLNNKHTVNIYEGNSRVNEQYKGQVNITNNWNHNPWYND